MEQTTTQTTTKRIVIVEDNTALAEIYKTRLELLGYQCYIAYNGITGLYFIQKEQPDLVLLDLMVPDIAGDQILLRMRGSNWGKNIKVLIISNLNESDAPAGLRDLGIEGYLVKANLSDDMIDQVVQRTIGPAQGPAPAPASETAIAEAAPTPNAIEVPPAEN